MELTKNFTLEEFLESPTAKEQGFDEQFTPTKFTIHNLNNLCEEVLQPLRDKYKKSIPITSGYRCERLNDFIKGAKNSQHLQGKAADISVGSKRDNRELFKLIINLNLPFDQLINEQNYTWIHVSYDPTQNRKMIINL